jgi:phage major head subunit gpT-like protein
MPFSTQSSNTSLMEGLAAANTTFETAYNELYSQQLPGVYTNYTKIIQGNTMALDLRWTTNHPVMRKWLGSRVEKYVRTYQQSYVLEKYEATLPIPRMLLQYSNNMNLIGDTIDTFVKNQAQAYDAACSAALDGNSGAGPTCFDGVSLFSAAHPHAPGGTTQSNLSAGTNLNWVNFDAARAAMSQFKFENGEPAQMRPTHLRVGPKLETRAKEIVGAQMRVATYNNTGGQDAVSGVVAGVPLVNIWHGELDVIVDQRITNFFWDLLDLSKPGVTPIILYEGRKPEPVHLDKMTDLPRFYNDNFIYGLEGDFTAGAGMWMTAYKTLREGPAGVASPSSRRTLVERTRHQCKHRRQRSLNCSCHAIAEPPRSSVRIRW